MEETEEQLVIDEADLVLSYGYVLPFEAAFRASNRWTKGWYLSGITRFASGMPVTLYNNTDSSLLGSMPNGVNNNGVDMPNYTPGPLNIQTDPRGGLPAFNTSLFSLPSLEAVLPLIPHALAVIQGAANLHHEGEPARR